MSSFDSVKTYVLEILKENEQARDDDFILTMNVYVKMGFAKKLPIGIIIDFKNPGFDSRPAWETITRVRREIQHEMGLFKPSAAARSRRQLHRAEIEERYSSAPVQVQAHLTKYANPYSQGNSWMSP